MGISTVVVVAAFRETTRAVITSTVATFSSVVSVKLMAAIIAWRESSVATVGIAVKRRLWTTSKTSSERRRSVRRLRGLLEVIVLLLLLSLMLLPLRMHIVSTGVSCLAVLVSFLVSIKASAILSAIFESIVPVHSDHTIEDSERSNKNAWRWDLREIVLRNQCSLRLGDVFYCYSRFFVGLIAAHISWALRSPPSTEILTWWNRILQRYLHE